MEFDEELQKICLDIVKEIGEHPIAEIFLNPVDPELDGVPDYLDKIKEPSDLSTVQSNLECKKYKNIEEFKHAMNLIWENAKLYNGPNSLITAIADRLSTIFQHRMKPLEERPYDSWVNDYLQAQTTLYKLFRSQPKPLEMFNLSPDMEMLVPERKMARSYLTHEDQKFFAKNFKLIEDPAALTKIIHIISETEPTIDFSEEEIQINLAALSQKTIRMLKAWATEQKEQQTRHPTLIVE